MRKMLKKELKLTASVLSYLFIVFGLMAFIPGYPILVGTFFVSLGMFQSFQAAREANDITYSALLPVAKENVVKGKYAFCLFIECCYFILTGAITLLRMTFLANAPVYRTNVMMPANLCYLGYVLLIFGCFNAVFIGGFFKTAYKFGKPFLAFCVTAFLIVGLGETLFHIPGLESLGAFGFEHIGTQVSVLGGGIALFVVMTYCSMRKAVNNFERIDL